MRPLGAAMVVAASALACSAPPVSPPDAAAPAADAGCSGGGDGYADPPGSGALWLLDQVALSAAGVGLDVTGDGVPDTAINEAFGFYSFTFNSALRRSIENARALYMLEVAGLCAPYRGADPDVTVKIYDVEDANSIMADNFCRDPGCGTMLADQTDWTDEGQPASRSQPTALSEFRLATAVPSASSLGVDDTTEFVLLARHVAITVPELLDEIPSGWLCGALAAAALDAVVPPREGDPECRTLCWPEDAPPGLSIAGFLAWRGFQPDLDLDGDGLERYELDRTLQVARCHDGPRAPPATSRWSDPCLSDPRMADGFSLCFDVHALPGVLLVE